MPMETNYAQTLEYLMTGSDLPSFLTPDDPTKTSMLCTISSFGKHTHISLSGNIFFPVSIDTFAIPLFLFCKQHTKCALGKYLQKFWQGEPRLCPVLPAGLWGTRPPKQWAPALGPRWFDLSAFWLQISLCTHNISCTFSAPIV